MAAGFTPSDVLPLARAFFNGVAHLVASSTAFVRIGMNELYAQATRVLLLASNLQEILQTATTAKTLDEALTSLDKAKIQLDALIKAAHRAASSVSVGN
jgi:hypothetical protein